LDRQAITTKTVAIGSCGA